MRSLLVIALFLSAGVHTRAENQSFKHFTVEDGLSQGSVNVLLQDHRGYIWIGTQDGLNRFDGITFKVFRHDPGDSTSLSSSWITALYQDSTRNLWVGTIDGLNLFDPATGTFSSMSPEHGEHHQVPQRSVQ